MTPDSRQEKFKGFKRFGCWECLGYIQLLGLGGFRVGLFRYDSWGLAFGSVLLGLRFRVFRAFGLICVFRISWVQVQCCWGFRRGWFSRDVGSLGFGLGLLNRAGVIPRGPDPSIV